MTALFDLEIVSSTDDEVRARVPVTDACKQPLGLVHGGVYAIIADTLTAGARRGVNKPTRVLCPVTRGGVYPPPPRPPHGRPPPRGGASLSDDHAGACARGR